MPWLARTARRALNHRHGEARRPQVWTILLAVLAFSLSLLGTFLVRSGVLTSVHTFASDPGRVFHSCHLIFFIGGGFVLYAWRGAGAEKQGGLFAPVSREGALG